MLQMLGNPFLFIVALESALLRLSAIKGFLKILFVRISQLLILGILTYVILDEEEKSRQT